MVGLCWSCCLLLPGAPTDEADGDEEEADDEEAGTGDKEIKCGRRSISSPSPVVMLETEEMRSFQPF